jgi:hypothetical protein
MFLFLCALALSSMSETEMADTYTCEQLKAAIDAEQDPTRKAALSLDYRQHCLLGGDQKPTSGGHGPVVPD